MTSSDTVTLEVKGRRSGRVRYNPVTWVEHDGEWYLVSPRGESEWVRGRFEVRLDVMLSVIALQACALAFPAQMRECVQAVA